MDRMYLRNENKTDLCEKDNFCRRKKNGNSKFPKDIDCSAPPMSTKSQLLFSTVVSSISMCLLEDFFAYMYQG